MAKAVLGDRSVVDWDKFINSYDAIRHDVEQCIPGFENYNERVVQKGGFIFRMLQETAYSTANFSWKSSLQHYIGTG